MLKLSLLLLFVFPDISNAKTFYYANMSIEANSLKEASIICFYSIQNKPFSYEKGLNIIDYCVNPLKEKN